MYKQIIALTLVAFASVSYGQVHGWGNCGSPLGELYELRIISETNNCLQTPCPIVRGQDHRIEVDVGARGYAYSLNFTTTVTIPFLGTIIILEGNACDDADVHCPVQPGDYFTFVEIINIPQAVPALTVTATTNVITDDGSAAMCFQVPVALQ